MKKKVQDEDWKAEIAAQGKTEMKKTEKRTQIEPCRRAQNHRAAERLIWKDGYYRTYRIIKHSARYGDDVSN